MKVPEVVKELGIHGGVGPTAVTGQTDELGNIVRWVQQSDVYIQRIRIDWKFLRYNHSVTLGVGDQNPANPSVSVKRWDPRWFYLDRGLNTQLHLSFVPYPDVIERIHAKVLSPTNGPPVQIGYDPTHPTFELWLDRTVDRPYTFDAVGWRKPYAMTANADLSPIPEEYIRLLISRTKIIWAGREDAPEVMAESMAEYDDLLEDMKADQTEGNEAELMGHEPSDLTVETDMAQDNTYFY